MINLKLIEPEKSICKKTYFQDLLKQLPKAREEQSEIHKKIKKLFDGDAKLKETYKKIEDAKNALNAALGEAHQHQNRLMETAEGKQFISELNHAQDRCQKLRQQLFSAVEDEYMEIAREECNEPTKKNKQALLIKACAEAAFGQEIVSRLMNILDQGSGSIILQIPAIER